MGKINVLQPDVFNMISAGEVVERPASVVKELVENSIDAGASSVDVYVEEGGIKRITVSDNGTGIAADDMRAAFMPHATSKLKEISDLDTIATLGFRGEALASIASVSEVTAVSRVKGAAAARKITLSAGKVVSECDDSRAEGTVISVENLFFNTPARLKFLKKPSSELNYVCDVVEKTVLANPQLRVRVSTERDVLLEHEGGSLADAMRTVYSNLDMDRFLAVDRTASSGIKVSGYVSKVDYTAPTRSKQTIIVNGRVVENDTVSAAVDSVYRDYLMKRTYPMYVLDVVVPFEDVDVNVHPAKTEVRFRNKNAVFGAVMRAVEEAVTASVYSEKAGFSRSEDRNDALRSETTANNYEQTELDTAALYVAEIPDNNAYGTTDREKDAFSSAKGYFDISSFSHLGSAGKTFSQVADKQLASSFVRTDAGYDNEYAYSRLQNDNDKDFANSCDTPFRVFDGAVVGQIFDTYLIVERGEKVYVIDQHAAHERVLYDKLIASLSSDYAQSLLIPHKLKFYGAEADYFEKIMPSLNGMGFDIEKKGGNYFVYSVPEPVVNMDFSKFVAALFENVLEDGELKISDLIKDTVARTACRAAIKGGESLTKRQIEYVIANLVDADGNLPSKCPHGRPAVVTFTKRDVEKLFKRIVQ